ncbi:MAG: Beta-galactosidase [Methanosaeta sp. PtaB.Bin039]|nr:MAG: Beta-galactosidase [Methanosaeta sp. PtaB.Bin039]
MTLRDTFAGIFGKQELPPLAGHFIFGVATADHQCEAFDPKYPDIRDRWEEIRCPEAARGRATDFWNRYEEDIELAQKLGCNAFRFSIAWSRVDLGEDGWNEDAFDHYRKLIEKIRSCDMTPVLTLHHFTWPLHVEARGGMIGPDFPDIYADYVREVADRFAKLVPYWITFNEPNLLIGGYLKPWWDSNYAAPPGLPEGTTTSEQVEAVGRLIRNLFLANKEAYQIVRDRNRDAKVGVNQYFYGLPKWLQFLANRNALAIKGDGDLKVQADRLALKRDLIRGERISAIRSSVFERGKVDAVIAALAKTSERDAEVMLSQPYFCTKKLLLVGVDSDIDKASELAGKEVAVLRGPTSEPGVPKYLTGSRAITFYDYNEALKSLDSGRVSSILGDDAILIGLMLRHPGRYRLVDGEFHDRESYSVAISEGDGELLSLVDSAVRSFNTSPEAAQWRANYSQLTGRTASKPQTISRSIVISESSARIAAARRIDSIDKLSRAAPGTALRRIQDRGYLVVVVSEDLPWFGYRDADTGNLGGLEIMLAHALAERILGDPDKVRFQTLAFQKRMASLETKPGFLDRILKQYTILSTLLMSNWWYMGMAGKLNDYLCPEDCRHKLDYVGLDYYWGIPSLHIERLQRLIDAAYRRFDRAPVWPGALYDILRDLHEMFPHKPLIIFENGSVKEADGWDRETYIREHIRQVQRAANDGLGVEGYLCWSITSNREWDLKFNDASDFGLYNIQLDSDPMLTRRRGPAADTYEQIIRNRGVG